MSQRGQVLKNRKKYQTDPSSMAFSFQKVKLYPSLNNNVMIQMREPHSTHLCETLSYICKCTALPSTEKKHAYFSPSSSAVGKCLSESMTESKKVLLKKCPLKLLGFAHMSLCMVYGPPKPSVRVTPTLHTALNEIFLLREV